LLQRAPAVPRLNKEASVKNVEPAGLNQLKMLVTVNTNGQNKELPHTAVVERI